MTTMASSPGHPIRPFRAPGVLHRHALGRARCLACGCMSSKDILDTLRQIAALPDAPGARACEECWHPEMRRLPDAVFRCPACG